MPNKFRIISCLDHSLLKESSIFNCIHPIKGGWTENIWKILSFDDFDDLGYFDEREWYINNQNKLFYRDKMIKKDIETKSLISFSLKKSLISQKFKIIKVGPFSTNKHKPSGNLTNHSVSLINN